MGKNSIPSGTVRKPTHLQRRFWMKLSDALKTPWVSLVPILLLGAYLRLYRISEYLTFLGDEGRDVLVVKRMIVDGKFTLLGPTASVGGFFLGPIYYYFMAPFLWLWNLDPTGPAVMVALFGIATIFLVYYVGKEFFSHTVGIIAALLYTLSPITIAYARSSWNPNLVPFFSLLLILLLRRTVRAPTMRELVLIGITLGIGLQLHYLFLFLFPVTVFWLAVAGSPRFRSGEAGRRDLYLRYAMGILPGFLLGCSPFLLFEIRHGFPNTLTILKFLREGDETGFGIGTFVSTVVDVTYRLYARLVLRIPQKELWGQFPQWQRVGWVLGTWVVIVGSLGTLFAVWKQKPAKLMRMISDRKDSSGPALLFIIWFAFIIVLFGFYKRGIYEYYFGIFFPFPFLSLALGLWVMLRFRLTKIIAVCILVGLVYSNWEGRPFKYPPNNQLAQAKLIASTALDKTGGEPFNFALITASNSDHAFRYFFEIWGRAPVTIENSVIDPERKSVTDQLIVICDDPGCQPLGHPLWEVAGFGRAEVTGVWDVPFVKIFRLVHAEEPRGNKKRFL